MENMPLTIFTLIMAIFFVTIQPPSKRIPFLGVFVNDM